MVEPSNSVTFSEYETAFNRMLAEESFDVENNIEKYTSRKYKPVRSLDNRNLHCVPSETWKSFRSSVLSSGLTHEEKNKFINQGANYNAVRELYRTSIEKHPSWALTAHWYSLQDSLIQEFENEIKETSEVYSYSNENKTIRIQFNEQEQQYTIPVERINSLKDSLALKKEHSQQVSRIMPEIVYSLFQYCLDSRAAHYIKSITVEQETSYQKELEEFAELLKKSHASFEQNLHVYSPSFNEAYTNPVTGEPHMLNAKDSQKFFTKLQNRENFRTRYHPFLKHVISLQNDQFEQLIPYMEKHEDWKLSQQIISEVEKIHEEFLVSSENLNPKKKISATKEQYEALIKQLYAVDKTDDLNDFSFTLIFNLTKMKIRQTVKKTLTALKEKDIKSKTEHAQLVECSEYNSGLYYVHVSRLTLDELAEFYVCGRKRSYPTAEEAWVWMHVSGSKTESSVYQCSYCKQYHYGITGRSHMTVEETAEKGREQYLLSVKHANRFVLYKKIYSL